MASPTWSVGQVLTASDVNNWFVDDAAYKLSATGRSTLTVSADPDLTLAVSASCIYEVRAAIVYSAGTASVGMKTSWTVPSGASGAYNAVFNLGGTGQGCYGYTWSSTPSPGNVDSSVYGIQLQGLLNVSTTSGSLTFNWASNTSGQTMTVGVGSYLAIRRIG